MKKQLVYLMCLLLCASVSFAQSKQKTTAKPVPSAFEKVLNDIGFEYEKISDSLAEIPVEGTNIPSIKVRLGKVDDLYIIYLNLTKALPGKLDETKYQYLLQKNNFFDVVKISLDKVDKAQDFFYIRAEVYAYGAKAANLKRIVIQVADAADIIAGELK